MRIAAYSCNFGDYRNELRRGIDRFEYDRSIDYFFFTDNLQLKSAIWKIVQVPLLQGDNVMDANRWTSKFIKFVLPEILATYDVVIWCDSKLLKRGFRLDKSKIGNLCRNYTLVNYKHPDRNTLQEELTFTMDIGLENSSGKLFQAEIADKKYTTPLADTCFIIRKTDNETNALMARVFELLKEKGLKRDQNIYSHAIDDVQYPPAQIRWIRSVYL